MRTPLFLHVVALATAVVLTAAVAGGQNGDGSQRARPHAEMGFVLYQRAEYAAALSEFEAAERYFHAPPHLLYIARSQAALGRLLEARATYARVAGETVDAAAPEAFRLAPEQAKNELAALREKIPRARVVVRGTAAAELTVDGVDTQPGEVDLDPGEHTFVARSEGMPPATATLVLSEGEHRDVVLDVVPESEEDSSPSLVIPSAIAFATGGLALLVGSVTGVMSLDKASKIDDQCVGDRCPSALEPEADEAKALGHASTALFIVGGAAIALGTILILIDEDDGSAVGLRAGANRIALEARW